MSRTQLLTRGRPVVACLLALVATLPAAAQHAPGSYEEALHEYQNLDNEKALDLANELLVKNPLDTQAADLRARCLIYLGRLQDALATLERIPDPPQGIRVLLAEVLALNDRTDEAMQIIDDLLLEDNGLLEARVKRAKIYLRSGEIQKALNEVNLLRQFDERNGEAQLVAAMAHEAAKDLAGAARLYRSLIDRSQVFKVDDPHTELLAVEGLARVSAAAGRYDEAASYYEQLAERFPDSPSYQFRLSACYTRLGEHDKALQAVKSAVDAEPERAEYRLAMADIYISAGRPEDAISEYEWLNENGSDPRLPCLRLADLYLRQGDVAKARANADVVLNLAPESADVQEVVGRVLEKAGDVENAESAYRTALALDPLHRAMRQLGELLVKQDSDEEKRREGQALLKRFGEIQPYLPLVRRAQMELSSFPENVFVIVNLAAVLNAAGEYELAEQTIQRALELGDDRVETHQVAGFIAANRGQTDVALREFERTLELLGGTNPQLEQLISKMQAGEEIPLPLGQLPASAFGQRP